MDASGVSMGESRVLRVVAQRTSLARVNEIVRQAAERVGLEARAVFQVEMALDEAFSNVVEHAYAGRASGDVEVSWSIEDGAFVVVLRDWGQTFDPASVPEPDLAASLEERSLGGLGLHFMRSLMDSVDYTFDEDGNRLRMTKALPE
jgi:anti-sigma regulatory factor (Ser/Thr protein kinase)